jgi:hypothetical protein
VDVLLLGLAHARLTCALVVEPFAAVSKNCEDEIIVFSQAAPTVRAEKVFEKGLPVAGCQLSDASGSRY